MDAKGFQVFVEQMAGLMAVQRSTLSAALSGKGPANETIALIEMQFATPPACGHCKGEQFIALGHANCVGTNAKAAAALSTHTWGRRWPSCTVATSGWSTPVPSWIASVCAEPPDAPTSELSPNSQRRG